MIMNLQAIIVANVTGFLLILFLLISRFITRTKSSTEDIALNSMMWLVLIACIVEPVTFAVDGWHSTLGYWTNLIGNTYLYYANGVGTFLWLLYVDLNLYHDRSRMKKIYCKLSIPVSLLLLSLIANIWFKHYFYIDENFIYHRRDTLTIFYLYMVFCAFFSIGMYFHYKHTHGHVPFFPISMYLIPVIAGSIAQMLFYGISTAWLSCAIGITAMHNSLLQQKTYTDNLTGLYNRHYLEHAVFSINQRNRSYYGIMIDMNDFKAINDTYGHSVGDQALIDMAEIFKTTLDKRSTAYRFAGDEFIIITKTSKENEVIKLENNLKEATKRFNEKNLRPYNLSFAFGHDIFDVDSDNEDSFLKKIDDAMYEDKKASKTLYIA